jgi:hypothetical protein
MNVGVDQQVSIEVVDGKRGVRNEKHVEVRVMGQQACVEDVVPLLPNEIIDQGVANGSE